MLLVPLHFRDSFFRLLEGHRQMKSREPQRSECIHRMVMKMMRCSLAFLSDAVRRMCASSDDC